MTAILEPSPKGSPLWLQKQIKSDENHLRIPKLWDTFTTHRGKVTGN